MTVLWIEDSTDDIELFSIAFERTGVPFRFDIKNDGQQGLDYLLKVRHNSRERPDLILLDLNLPKRDGREVLAEIKKHDDLRMIPVVVLTTSNADVDIVTAYSFGASCYLVKPDGMPNVMKMAKALSDFWQQVQTAKNTGSV